MNPSGLRGRPPHIDSRGDTPRGTPVPEFSRIVLAETLDEGGSSLDIEADDLEISQRCQNDGPAWNRHKEDSQETKQRPLALESEDSE